jgi:hypothetical protein
MEITKAEIASGSSAPINLKTCGALNPSRSLQAEEGVKYIWGAPSRCAVLHIYDACSSRTRSSVLVRHEQAAVHAADGYAAPLAMIWRG